MPPDSRRTTGGESIPVTPHHTSGEPVSRIAASNPAQAGIVVINPDGSNVAASSGTTGSSAATLTNVAADTTSKVLAAANSSRLGLTVHNDSSAVLYLKYGAAATTTSYSYRLEPNATFEMPSPVYTGVVEGIWSAVVGAARVTER